MADKDRTSEKRRRPQSPPRDKARPGPQRPDVVPPDLDLTYHDEGLWDDQRGRLGPAGRPTGSPHDTWRYPPELP